MSPIACAGPPASARSPASARRDAALAAALERWFGRAARDLPWRRGRTGYRALVAEAMLQQTQAAQVAERYGVFLRRFPTVCALAAAELREVLAVWQGLGYYRRARHLHRAAAVIAAEHGGRVPRSAAALRRLPGVGRYTAGSIASIVYGRREPIVDGNVQRVLARLEARSGRVPAAGSDGWSWTRAASLVEAAERPGVLNEALMELGATVCIPRAPRCGACPVARFCAARRGGLTAGIPSPLPRRRRSIVHHHAVVVRRGAKILFVERGEGGLWAGLWQPPAVEARCRLGPAIVAARLELAVTELRAVGSFDHLTTHRRVRFHVYTARSRRRGGTWRSPGAVSDLPMSSAHRRVLALALAEADAPGGLQPVRAGAGWASAGSSVRAEG